MALSIYTDEPPWLILNTQFELTVSHKMRETYYFKLRCLYPSVCLFVRPSVRHHSVSTLFISNPWWDLQTTLHKCQVDDSMCRPYVWPKSVQGQGHSSRLNIACFRPFSKFNNFDYHYNKLDAPFPMLQSMVYSILPVIVLVNDPKYLPVENNCFHPLSYGERLDCFSFRKHPCCCLMILHQKHARRDLFRCLDFTWPRILNKSSPVETEPL